MIRYVCAGCDTVVWSSSRLAGLPIKCEICRFENVVPDESSDETPLRSRRRYSAPRPAPRRRASVMGPVLIVLAVVGVVGLGAGAWRFAERAYQRELNGPLDRTVKSKDGNSQIQVPAAWKDVPFEFME